MTSLDLLAANWNQEGGWELGDFSGDGFIDVTELGLLASNWQGAGPPPTDVPELASVLLIMAGGGVVLRRRYRK